MNSSAVFVTLQDFLNLRPTTPIGNSSMVKEAAAMSLRIGGPWNVLFSSNFQISDNYILWTGLLIKVGIDLWKFNFKLGLFSIARIYFYFVLGKRQSTKRRFDAEFHKFVNQLTNVRRSVVLQCDYYYFCSLIRWSFNLLVKNELYFNEASDSPYQFSPSPLTSPI